MLAAFDFFEWLICQSHHF